MKMVGLREAKTSLSACIDTAQGERVIITRHGQPAAVLVGVEGEELEDVLRMADPSFWAMIEERRGQSNTVSEREARRELRVPGKRSNRRRRTRAPSRR